MRQKKKKMVRRGRAYWEGLVSQYEAAPCGHERFAAQNGLNVGTFRHWLYKLRAETSVPSERTTGPSKRGAGASARFVELVRDHADDSAVSESACVVRRSDAEVRFARLPPAKYLAKLLSRSDP